MDTKELLKKVRRIEIKTRGLSHQIFSGEYHSAFKGRGMTFSEVREYQHGDDIRQIDWNVTARYDKPFVKIFEEERELTLMLLVDLSSSGEFGTKEYLKRQYITEICAVLSFSANQNNDKVGAVFFTDRVEKFIPPKKGRSHTLHIVRELIEFRPQSKKTDIGSALAYFTNVIKKRSIAFLLSDFYDSGFGNALTIANRKHDIVALGVSDPLEHHVPNVGLVKAIEPETGNFIWLDTSSMSFRNLYHQKVLQHHSGIERVMQKSGVDFVSIRTDQNYVQPLMSVFKKREARK